MVGQLRPRPDSPASVRSDLPAGSGLSSSAALEVACALALGADAGDPIGLARLCQAAEHAARGVPTGLLDQLASICGVEGCGLHLDCRSLEITAVPLPPPDVAQWLVVWAGARSLAQSGYAQRVAELAAAEAIVGPLRDATSRRPRRIGDPVVRARARHVLSENARVNDFAAAIAAGDLVGAGALMSESHASLSGDFECSTPEIDELCRELWGISGVFGARMTGGGWGGCVVALTDPVPWTSPPSGSGVARQTRVPGADGAPRCVATSQSMTTASVTDRVRRRQPSASDPPLRRNDCRERNLLTAQPGWIPSAQSRAAASSIDWL